MSKKIQKRLEELVNSLPENESILILYKGKDDVFSYMGKTDDPVDYAAGIATIIDDAYVDNDDRAKVIADAVMDGVSAVIKRSEKAGRVTVGKLMPAFADAAKGAIERLRSMIKADIEDDGEDCANCEDRFICPLKDAIKWRKENHVPAPRRRNGNKGNKRNHAN